MSDKRIKGTRSEKFIEAIRLNAERILHIVARSEVSLSGGTKL